MHEETYIDPAAVKSFFRLLESSDIDYVLIKNVGGELPNKLKKNKDIDILVKDRDEERFTSLMLSSGFEGITHPHSHRGGWCLAYGASDIASFKNNDFLTVDVCSKLCLKSLMGNIWIPIDKYINDRVWKNKIWDLSNGWWALDDETLLVYLVSRCVFDKGAFNQSYVEEIESRAELLHRDEVQEMLRMVFFRFKDKLIEMLADKLYDSIVESYISFNSY